MSDSRERLVDQRGLEGVDAELAADVAAAVSTLSRTRLSPDAVDRIEAKLDVLESEAAFYPFLRFARGALGVAVAAALVVLVWNRMPTTPAPTTPSVATRAASRPLHLSSGTLAVATDEDTIIVETPSARIEVAPRSHVDIVVFESSVRIAASSGSARIVYYDGRTELVSPLPSPVAKPTTPVRAPKRAHVAASLHAAPVAAEPDDERDAFERAIAHVRATPAEALTLLDAFLKRYPDGAHHDEAQRIEVALLLKLDRKADARATLERASALPPELRVVRAELRFEAGRAEEAIADFGAVLISGDERFRPRALLGRALAWKRLGDASRMTDDLQQLLLIAPRGELAERARAELAHASPR